VPKGSIAIDGVSLTIAALVDRLLTVQIVPFTWTHTTLAALVRGQAVNAEADVLGKYVVRLLSGRIDRARELSSAGRIPIIARRCISRKAADAGARSPQSTKRSPPSPPGASSSSSTTKIARTKATLRSPRRPRRPRRSTS
jgi:hypothetical protein